MIRDLNLNENIKKDGVVILDFFAQWCGPCKMLMPVITEIGNTTNHEILKADIDVFRDLAKEFNIKTIPTVILIKDGIEVRRFSGYKTKASILDFIGE